MNNVCEDRILEAGMESVRVGLFVCTRSNAEETCFRVDCPETAVFADAEPCDIVTYALNFISLFLVSLRRDEHSEVCLTAS